MKKVEKIGGKLKISAHKNVIEFFFIIYGFHVEDQLCQVGLFSAQNHNLGFFRVLGFFSEKQPTKFGFLGLF